MCSWDKTRDRKRRILGEQMLAEPGFCPMFSEVVHQSCQDCSSRFNCLEGSLGTFQNKKCMSSQSTAVPSDFVYFPANRHVFRDSNDKCLEYLFWPLWVTFLMPLFSPSVKWEMSPYQVLESINTKGS